MYGHLNVVPPLVDPGKSSNLLESGRTLDMKVSPLNDSHAIFVAPTVLKDLLYHSHSLTLTVTFLICALSILT